MPRFDFECPRCGLVRKDVWVSVMRAGLDRMDISPCEACGEELRKLPAAPAFRVEGYNAKNGYSK